MNLHNLVNQYVVGPASLELVVEVTVRDGLAAQSRGGRSPLLSHQRQVGALLAQLGEPLNVSLVVVLVDPRGNGTRVITFHFTQIL